MMRFLKKHTWILTAFFALVLFPQSLTLQSKLDGRLIITGLAIDKSNDKYLVTAQIVSPTSGALSQSEQAGVDFVSVESDTIRAGILDIATMTGKTPGLAHLNYVVFGSSLFDEDIANLLDFVAREAHSDTSVLVLVAENAQEEIKKTKDLDLGTAVTMRKTYLGKQKQSNGVLAVTNEFIANKYNPSRSSVVNYLEIELEKDQSQNQGEQNGENQGSSQGSSEGSGGSAAEGSGGGASEGSGGSQGSGEQSSSQTKLQKQGRIKYISPLALFLDGKFSGQLKSEKEVMGYHFSNPKCKELAFGFDSINTSTLGSAKVTLKSKKKKSKISCKIEDGKPKAKISVELKNNEVMEIISSTPNNQNIYNTQEDYLTKEMRKDMEQQIKSYILEAFESSRAQGVDAFNCCNDLYRHHKKQYDSYFAAHSFEDFLNSLELEVKVKVASAN